MSVAVSVKTHALPNVCLRRVVNTNPKGAKTECVLSEGNSSLVSNFVASFIRAGDELLLPLEHEGVDAGAQISIPTTKPEEGRGNVFQAEIGYATQPRKDKLNNLFVS